MVDGQDVAGTEVLTQAENDADTVDSDPNHSWAYGQEDSQAWNDYLHTYQKQWVRLILVTCTPSAIIFSIGILISIANTNWYAISFGTFYEPKGETTMYTVPSILKNHFVGAATMLPLIIIQVVLAALAVWSPAGSDRRGKFFSWHAKFGILPSGAIIFAVTLGTLALGFCDFQPKRGAETAFFVLVGIAILWSCLVALMYAQKGLTGLHMQYMFYTCYGVFSPGWNRIITVLIRAAKGALSDEYAKACFYRWAWTGKGYYFTWSFLAGEIWLLGWWLLPISPLRAPFFKKYSVGFFLLAFQAMVMIACVFDLFIGGGDAGSIDCTIEELSQFQDFQLAVKTEGMYSFNDAYGLCSAANPEEIFGAPGVFLENPNYISADSGVITNHSKNFGALPIPSNTTTP